MYKWRCKRFKKDYGHIMSQLVVKQCTRGIFPDFWWFEIWASLFTLILKDFSISFFFLVCLVCMELFFVILVFFYRIESWWLEITTQLNWPKFSLIAFLIVILFLIQVWSNIASNIFFMVWKNLKNGWRLIMMKSFFLN